MNRKYFLQFITVIQVFLDYLTVVVSVLAAYFVYHMIFAKWQIGAGIQPFKIYRNLAFGSGFLFLIIFERFGLYSRKVGVMNVEELKRILQSIIIGSLILFSLSFLLRPIYMAPPPEFPPIGFGADGMLFESGPLLYSRLILLYSLVILMILINFQRQMMNKLLLYMHVTGPGLNRVLIYGAGDIGKQLQRRLFENHRIGLKPIGFIDDDLEKIGTEVMGLIGQRETSVKVLGDGLQLPELVKTWDIHEVIIAIPNASTTRIYEIINSCVLARVKFSFVPNLFDIFIQQVRFEEIEGIPLLRMKNRRTSYIYLMVKRLFDIVLASLGILVMVPFLPLIILLIKLDSRGPILFMQKRVGKDGKIFTMIKFRSMYVEAEKYGSSPTDGHDPRITRIGRLFRRLSFDEYPQFFNVLKGDMSIVGPRPEMPFVVETYTPLQKQRLNVRPGITGLWQISSARDHEIHENLDYDFYYAENQSFLLDLVVIAKTLAAGIKGRGV